MSGAVIVMADDGVPFDGTSLESGPLGGAETSFIGLAQGLAARGHRVLAYTGGRQRFTRDGVDWAPILNGLPETADLYVANRGHRLIDRVPGARRAAFWLHNPAGYVEKPRYLWPLFRRRPSVVFLGPFHASTLPFWVPTGGRVVIPYGITECFRTLPERAPPPPRAVFTSNPLRRLDWVLDRWADAIRPRVLGAELHVYSSLATYGGGSAAKRSEAEKVLAKARALADQGVVLESPRTKAGLADALAESRVFLYGGDPGETFCLAAAESQAAGVPGVVARSTCLAERITDGETGFVVEDDDTQGFADRAVALLTDDALWRRQHLACLATRRGLSWPKAAAFWEALLP
ncbi:MAG TPA: glycosyltransferase family 4 protein [Stellaceae bacterium]|nr:glycosyltransferase family 4 protein [Stellaceae bacterium]